MTHRILIGLGWAVCLAGFSGFLGTCQPKPDLAESENADLTYALDGDGFVRLQIDDPTEPLFLRAHLELPETLDLQARETVVYGVNVQTTGADGTAIRQDIWLRSRISLDEDGEPTLLGPLPLRSVTDGRHLELDLSEQAVRGGQVELRPLLNLPDSRLLLRVERRPHNVQMRLPWLGGAVLASRTARFTTLPWTSLTRTEIQKIWSDNRLPLSAVGLKGETVELLRRSPPSVTPLATTAPVRLLPGQSTTLTLQGPCSIEVDAAWVDTETAPPPEWLPAIERLQGRSPSSMDRISSTHVDVPQDALWSVVWTAPEASTELELNFTSSQGKACVWGQGTGSAWETTLSPETRRFTAWSLGLDEELLVPVASGSGRGVLVVEARPQLEPDQGPNPEAPSPAALSYQFENETGTVLQRGRTLVEQVGDAFDRRVEPSSGWMGQVTRVSLQHPPGATQVRFSTEAPADLRFLVPLPVEEERSAVYALPGGWTAQNAPWELAPYVSLTPLNSAELLAQQRLVRFDATVRPRRVLQSRPEGNTATRALEPKGQRLRYPILETVRRPGEWNTWHRTELGRNTRLRVPETGAISVDYRTTAVSPGDFELSCGEHDFLQPLNAGAGSFRLSGLPTNWTACRLSAPNGTYFANVPGSGKRWARRGIYRLKDRLEVDVDVPAGGTTVFVRVYTEAGQVAAPLTLKVDGGRPQIRSGVVAYPTTPTQRRTPLRTSRQARLIDDSQGTLVVHRGLGVVLGDDLRPGKHTVEVTLPEGADPVYVRFDSSAGGLSESSSRRHWYVDGGGR